MTSLARTSFPRARSGSEAASISCKKALTRSAFNASVRCRAYNAVYRIMWASDYPHTDGVWPESSKYIAEQFGHLPPDVVRKITCENAGKFYGLMT